MNTNVRNDPECPECQQLLIPLDGSTGSLRCGRCEGVFVRKTELQPEFWEVAVPAETGRETSETKNSETPNCPVCRSSVERLQIEGTPVGRCTGCGGAWLEHAPDSAESAGTQTGSALGRYLLYTMTLPERSLRSAIGLAGGFAKETAEWLVPQAFQSSKTYEIVVRNSLRFLTEDIAGVTGQADQAATADDYLARKAVGNFVDLAGLATLHVSPLWLLAIASDVAYGSRAYVLELAEELKREGIIDETSTIHHVDDVLAAVQQASGEAASLFDTPPLSVEQMQQTLDQTRAAASSADFHKILPQAELDRYWREMRDLTQAEEVSLLGVSGALTMHTLGKVQSASQAAFAGLQVAGGMLNRHVLGHYVDSLQALRERGFYPIVRESSAPYVEAVWKNFAGSRKTWTDEVVTGRALGSMFRKLRGWFVRDQHGDPPVEANVNNQQ